LTGVEGGNDVSGWSKLLNGNFSEQAVRRSQLSLESRSDLREIDWAEVVIVFRGE